MCNMLRNFGIEFCQAIVHVVNNLKLVYNPHRVSLHEAKLLIWNGAFSTVQKARKMPTIIGLTRCQNMNQVA